MKFTIIIPVKEVNDYLKKNLRIIDRVFKFCKDYEVIVVTNQHNKKNFLYKNLKFVASGKVGPGKKRDIGAKIAKGKYLIFLDDDSYPANNFVKILNKIFFKDNLKIAIGGPGITPKKSTFMEKVSGLFYSTKLTGGVPERYVSTNLSNKYIDDWPTVNFTINKELFFDIGGFNTKFWPGEDTILCDKILKKNSKLMLYNKDLVVWHHRRVNIFQHLQQLKNYSIHRGFFIKKFKKNSLKIKYFIPSLFVLSILVSVLNLLIFKITFITNLSNLLIITYLTYLVLIFLKTLKDGVFTSFSLIITTFFSQIVYGVFFLNGLFRKKLISKLR